jgi:uncharacterized coiled-coil DUF342 family protein
MSDRLKELDELADEVGVQRERIEVLRQEAKDWMEKRDNLNTQNRKIWLEAKELRKKRDELNEQIKKLKEERTKIYEQTTPKRTELENLRKRMDALLGGTSRSESATIRRIHELDWEIQTNPLTMAEEKAIIEQVKELEEQALIHKEAKTVRDRILELRSELVALRAAASNVHEKVTKLAEQSQSYHEEMLTRIKQTEGIKTQADEAHSQYAKARLQLDETQKKSAEALGRLRAIRLAMKQEKEDEAKKRVEALMAVESEAAMKKFKQRKKVTLEEFKILKSKGLI